MENVSLINVTAKNIKVINIQVSWHKMSRSLDKEEIFWHKEIQLFNTRKILHLLMKHSAPAVVRV